ncbi:MAG: hypothetical protein IT442_04990 [Phycisphaeraceae bacterium]|nr:hypothetical protein [Phycisphaeraceae bacterium]
MKNRRPLGQVLPVAEKLLALLAPTCERAILAGSIRRRDAEVGDIEIVAIPKRMPAGLFGEQEAVPLHDLLSNMSLDNRIFVISRGNRYAKFIYYTQDLVGGGIQVDLFMVHPETWGYQLAIRTGPSDFSRWLVTPRSKHGGLAEGYFCRDGIVWRMQSDPGGSAAVPVPEETDFFDLIAGGYVEPWLRRPAPMAG